MRVRKAVVPVAGYGTRFLPATRSVPKVMLPVLDTPPVHFVVEEAVSAGIEEVVFVQSPGQDALRAYFERVPDLERALERRGSTDLAQRMAAVSQMAEVRYVVQEEQLGLGHAVLTARDLVGDEPFAVFLPDDLIWSDVPTIGSMIQVFEERHNSVLAVKEVAEKAIPSLGIIAHEPVSERVSKVLGMVEKPSVEEAPSNLAIIGRYLLTPEVFDALAEVKPGAVGEIQLTDAIAMLLPTQGVSAFRFPGYQIDAGVPLGLLKASIYSALRSQELSSELRGWLAEALEQVGPD